MKSVIHYKDPKKVLEASEELGEAMPGIEMSTLNDDQKLASRGW